MLKFLNSDKKRILWLSIWATGLAIGSQLHFLGLFCLSGISIVILFLHYRLWKKSEIAKIASTTIAKKIILYFSIFALTAGIFYSPVIVSEVARKGENTKNFIQAFSSKPKDRPLGRKLTRSFDKQLKYYCLITTSSCYQGEFSGNKLPSLFTLAVFIAGIAVVIRNLAKSRNDSTNPAKKDFLRLVLIWFGILYLFSIPLYTSLRPRFFIFVFPLPFILLGMIFVYLEEIIGKRARFISVSLTAAIVALNAYGTKAWFGEQAKSQIENFTIQRTLILKNQDGVTLGQLDKVADFINGKRRKGADAYYYVKPEHIAPIKYLFQERGMENISSFDKITDLGGQYFAITPADKGIEPFENKFGSIYEILSSSQFGQITAFELKIKEKVENPNIEEAEVEDSEDSQEEQKISDRVFWKDIL
jgi:hypothetical protein